MAKKMNTNLVFLLLFSYVNSELYHMNDMDQNYQFLEAGEPLENDVNSEKDTNNVFSYVAAVILFGRLLSTGTLISDRWVLTSAENLYINRNNLGELSVRFGSVDYGRNGILVAVSSVEIHPYYGHGSPAYDLAMLRLSHPIVLSSKVRPLKLPSREDSIHDTDFLVPSWNTRSNSPHSHPERELKRMNRELKFSQLQREEVEECYNYLSNISVRTEVRNSLMCFYNRDSRDPCAKDTGAPLVSRGTIWGITSAFAPEDCYIEERPTLVTLLSTADIQVWINTLMKSVNWRRKVQINYFTSNDDDVTLLEQ